MVRALLVASLAALLCSASPAQDTPVQRVTLEIENKPLHEAAAHLAAISKLDIFVAPEIGDMLITLNARDIPPKTMLEILVRQASVSRPDIGVVPEGKGYKVRLLAVEEQPRGHVYWQLPDPRLSTPITLQFQNTPFRAAVERLLAGTGATASVRRDVPELPVSLSIRGETVFTGLRQLFEEAQLDAPGLRIERERGIYQFHVNGQSAPDRGALETAKAHRVNVSVSAVSLDEAMHLIFHGSGLQYSTENPPDIKVSLDIQNRSLTEALEEMLKSARRSYPHLRMLQSGRIFILQRSRNGR